MKIVVFFLTVIVVGSTKDVFRQNNYKLNSNAIIRQLFEMLKYFVKNGYSEKGIPVLDPSHFEYTDVEFSTPANLLNVHAGFANGVVSGFSDFKLLKTEFIKEDIAVNLCITFPIIIFKSGHYEMEGDIYYTIPIGGMGRFQFDMHNFTFWGKILLKQSDDGKSILIKNVTDPSFSVQQITSQTEFDGNVDDIINAIINELLAGYLTRFNQFIVKNYIDNVIDLLNPFLNKLESWRILAALL